MLETSIRLGPEAKNPKQALGNRERKSCSERKARKNSRNRKRGRGDKG